MKRFASIDIGSHTVRLLVADTDAAALYPLQRSRQTVSLGSGMHADGMLRSERIEQAADCIAAFCGLARAAGTADIHAAATACVRHARNRQQFLERVYAKAGICPEVLSASREALLSRSGILAAVNPASASALLIDIGGGSTEVSLVRDGTCEACASLGLGVLEPAERFMRHDPPSRTAITAMQHFIRGRLQGLPAAGIKYPLTPAPVLIATAGTATTLAAMDQQMLTYLPGRINGYRLESASIDRLLATMLDLPLSRRAGLPGLEEGRAAVIVPGALILRQLLECFRAGHCIVSDAGLLEGILVEHARLEKIIENA